MYDIVVVGSDEMWNEKNKAFNKYNTAASVNAGTRISYAVSMEIITQVKILTQWEAAV